MSATAGRERARRRAAGLCAALVAGTAGVLVSETLTFTTTYPAPSGVYASMITTGGSARSPRDTVLVRDHGSVFIGAPAGASPAPKLSVDGNVAIRDGTEAEGRLLSSDSVGTASWRALSSRAAVCHVALTRYGTWGCRAACEAGEFASGGGFDHAAAFTTGGAYSRPIPNGWECNVGKILRCTTGSPPCLSRCYAMCVKPR